MNLSDEWLPIEKYFEEDRIRKDVMECLLIYHDTEEFGDIRVAVAWYNTNKKEWEEEYTGFSLSNVTHFMEIPLGKSKKVWKNFSTSEDCDRKDLDNHLNKLTDDGWHIQSILTHYSNQFLITAYKIVRENEEVYEDEEKNIIKKRIRLAGD